LEQYLGGELKNMVSQKIMPVDLAIEAMRDSGYRDPAHALAELIDNSIQAGLGKNECTQVQVITFDRKQASSGRGRGRSCIEEIAVFDNACGMDAEVLAKALAFGNGTNTGKTRHDGIGKFGMGLPNSSISCGRRVDVWTWQKGRVLHSYLDIDEIKAKGMEMVPAPKEDKIPPQWVRRIGETSINTAHGTLVIWNKLDRIQWRTGATILKNSEFLIGRIYRRFLQRHQAEIVLKVYSVDESGNESLDENRVLKANDPLGLMLGTCAPGAYAKEPACDDCGEEIVNVRLNNAHYKIKIRFSIATPNVRAEGGASPIGQFLKKNQGVSVVRADRELEMNSSFTAVDTRERWWHCEVDFHPDLDSIFGVSNTKQSATNFKFTDLDSLAEDYGQTRKELEKELDDAEDPLLVIARISDVISKKLSTLRAQISRQAAGAKASGAYDPNSAEVMATQKTRKRQQDGKTGASDKTENEPDAKKRKTIEELLVQHGEPMAVAETRARVIVSEKYKYIFVKGELPSPAFFDVRSESGMIVITINTKHRVCDSLYDVLANEDGTPKDGDTAELKAIKLLISAWARMEDESGLDKRRVLERTRFEWGTIAEEFFDGI
jgi:hypothetical protein